MTIEAGSRPRVWIMEPEGSAEVGWYFSWKWDRWRPEPRLVITSDTRAASSLGQASFEVLRRTRLDPDEGLGANRWRYVRYTDQLVPGVWVAVTRGAGTRADPGMPRRQQMDPTAVLWWGYLDSLTLDRLRGVDDATGQATAYEVGHLLDQQRVQGAGEQHPSGTHAYRQLGNPPTANLEGLGGQIIGNAIAGTDIAGTGARAVHLFAPTAALCGTSTAQLWTRWRLLRHLLLVARPKGLPPVEFPAGVADDPAASSSDVYGYLNDPAYPEIYDPWEQTYRGAFDLLVPESHRLGWRIELPTTGSLDRWIFRVACTSDDDGYDLPVATAVNIDFSAGRDEHLRITDRSGEMPDEVAIRGGRIRFLASVSWQDSNLDQGWTAAQETAYEEATQAERTQPQHADAFCRFVLDPNSENRLRVVETPGLNSGGEHPLCPVMAWSGSVLSVDTDEGVAYTPYLPSIALASDLPWPAGLKGDGTDTRDAAAKARPSYLEPRLYHYDAGEDEWTDLLADNALTSETPQISMEDRGGALRIAYRIRHLLGSGTFDGDDDGGEPGTIDWRELVATIALDSDQPVYIARARTGVDHATAATKFGRMRRRLLVPDDRFQCWVALKGSVLGVTEDGDPLRITATNEPTGRAYVVRNDFPAAQRALDRLAAWAFRARLAAEITLIRPDDPPAWAQPLTVIGTVEDGSSEVVLELHTAVRTVTRTWGEQLRLTIATDLPSAPAAVGMAPSAVGGGPVSPSLGGTVPQAVRRLQAEVRDLRDRGRNRIIVPPRGGVGEELLLLYSEQGNTLLSSPATVKGMQVTGTNLTAVPAAEPTVGTTYANGLGWGKIFNADGSLPTGRVWIYNGPVLGVAGGLTSALVENNPFWCKMVYQVPITGGGGATALVYQPWRI